MFRTKGLFFLTGLLLVLGAAVPGAALAETWNWVMETHGANVSWTSPTAVSTTWADYVWSAEFTKIEAQLGGALWLDLTKEFGDVKDNGIAHALPFDLYKQHVNEPGTLVCDIYHWVDAGGSGQFTISNVVFGSLMGAPITGFRGTGSSTVVPEPVGIMLLVTGAMAIGLVFWKRRWR
jgi:hypothetical protein